MKRTLSLFYFFYFSLVGVYVMFLPKALSDMGYSAAEIGMIGFAAPIMRFLLPFLFKYLIPLDRRIYRLSLIFTTVASLIFIGVVDDFWFYLIANLLFGASMGISLPFVESISLAGLSKKEYGMVRLWGSVGFILVALWLGKALTQPQQTLYYLLGSAFATQLVGWRILRYDTLDKQEQSHANSHFSLRTFWAFWVSIFLMQLAFSGFYQFFTIYETAHGISLEVTSWLWSFGVICEIVMLYFQGSLLQRNLLSLLQFATLATAIRWLLLYLFAGDLLITFVAQSLHAISFALYHTASITYVFSLYPQKRLAQQFYLGIGFGLGGALGSILAGRIYGEKMFLIEAIITLGAWGMLLLHQKRVEQTI